MYVYIYITDMNRKLGNLLVEYSHCDSGTLATLFKTYFINIKRCQAWIYKDKYLVKMYTEWRKTIS